MPFQTRQLMVTYTYFVQGILAELNKRKTDSADMFDIGKNEFMGKLIPYAETLHKMQSQIAAEVPGVFDYEISNSLAPGLFFLLCVKKTNNKDYSLPEKNNFDYHVIALIEQWVREAITESTHIKQWLNQRISLNQANNDDDVMHFIRDLNHQFMNKTDPHIPLSLLGKYYNYLAHANDGRGNDITRPGKKLKTLEIWLND